MRPWRRRRRSRGRLWSTADGCRTPCSKRSRPAKRRPSLTRCLEILPTRVPRSVAVSPGSTAGAPASRTASGRSRCHGGRRPVGWTPCSTRDNSSCYCPARPGLESTKRTVRVVFTGSRAGSLHGKMRTTLGGALDEKRERQPDDESRVGRFGWPEAARLRYFDEDGNRISKEEWRELGRRRAGQ